MSKFGHMSLVSAYTQREDGMVNYNQQWRSVPGYLKHGGKWENIKWFNDSEGYKADIKMKSRDTNILSQLYILNDPLKPGWCKLGLAAYGGNRLGQYLTSDPYRNIRPWILWTMSKENAKAVEKYIKQNFICNREWFNIEPYQLAEFVSEEIERNNYEIII